tara:strand:- start:2372 stop:2497 length:126 start_codon:yes stop_codon:yes gene_type:complete
MSTDMEKNKIDISINDIIVFILYMIKSSGNQSNILSIIFLK